MLMGDDPWAVEVGVVPIRRFPDRDFRGILQISHPCPFSTLVKSSPKIQEININRLSEESATA